jgi:hypothetical protein
MSKAEQSERRNKKRASSILSVYCSFSPEPHKDSNCYGMTMNISESGLCMYTVCEIKEGTELKVSGKKWSGSRTATVSMV